MHLQHDDHDASKEKLYLKHCSSNRVHQTAESTSEKQEIVVVSFGHIGSKQIQTAITHRRITDIQLHEDYKSHVTDCETCCLRDNRRSNMRRE